MRFPKIFLPILFMAFLAVSAGQVARHLPMPPTGLVGQKYAGFSGVLQIWYPENLSENFGSAATWVGGVAATFEKNNPGVYIHLTAVPPERLVLDLSCRRVQGRYHVAYNRWQSVCPSPLGPDTFRQLAEFCSEFLVHAVDVEGLQRGIDPVLAELLASDCPLPVTYAGGARSMEDVLLLERLGQGRVDVTVGSALDLFGGTGIAYRELVEFDRQRRQP